MSRKTKLRYLPALLLIAAVLLLSGCAFSWESEDQPVLVVTGSGLVEDESDPASLGNERAYSLEELAALPQTEQVYSTFNTGEFRKQAIASGVAVDDLLAASGFDSDRDDDAKADFTFASGDYGKEFPALFSTALFRYPNQMAGDFDTKEYTRPLIAMSFAISGDNSDEVPAAEAMEALDLPMLTVGAQSPEDMNNSSFIKELDTVCVGKPPDRGHHGLRQRDDPRAIAAPAPGVLHLRRHHLPRRGRIQPVRAAGHSGRGHRRADRARAGPGGDHLLQSGRRQPAAVPGEGYHRRGQHDDAGHRMQG